MILYIVRHASAGERVADPKKDEKRPLDEQGRLQSRYVGRLLTQTENIPDVVITSPLTRAMQTASIIANEIGYEQKLEVTPALKPAATFEQFKTMLAAHSKADAVMVVGHNPNLAEFVSRLLSPKGHAVEVDLRKGAVAKLDMKKSRAQLLWLITPKLVRAAHDDGKANSRPNTSRK